MKLAVIAAMWDELSPFLDAINDIVLEKNIDLRHLKFHSGRLDGFQIILAQTGLGKVNSAVASQILIDRFSIFCIIHVGVAGAVSPHLKVGDIVIGNRFIQHDMDLTAFKIPYGEIVFDIPPIKDKLIIDRQLCLKEFEADPALVDLAEKVSRNLTFNHSLQLEAPNNSNIITGTIISGDQFVTTPKKTKILYETFKAEATDMESGAVAQVCYLNRVPYLGIRAICDNADHSAPVDFIKYLNVAATNCYKIVSRMIQAWNIK